LTTQGVLAANAGVVGVFVVEKIEQKRWVTTLIFDDLWLRLASLNCTNFFLQEN
jgi:hypothetical protein